MRKIFWVLPLAFLLAGTVAYAAFDGSHHDLRVYSSSAQGCYHCHGRVATATPDAAIAADVGIVGTLCLYRCHAAVGAFATDPAALRPIPPDYANLTTGAYASRTADINIVRMNMTTGAHARTLGNFDTAVKSGTNLPYAASGANSGNIECTSCHAVHDNANPPFLWAPMIGQNNDGLCNLCHQQYVGPQNMDNTAAQLPDGNHPVDFVIDNTATSNTGSRQRGTATASAFGTVRHGRTISIDLWNVWSGGPGGNGPFDVVVPTTLSTQAQNYPTGGHMARSDNTLNTFVSGNSRMGCATCHAAHNPGAAGSGVSNLVVLGLTDLANGYNPICTGCHGAASTLAGNQAEWEVGVSGNGHPAGTTANQVAAGTYDVTTAVNFQFAINTTGKQFGSNGEPMCSSCHGVHQRVDGTGTVAGTMLIKNYGQAATYVVCKTCHDGSGLPNSQDASKGTSTETANTHHRTRVAGSLPAAGGSTATYVPAEETGSTPLFIKAPTWAGAGAPYGANEAALGLGSLDLGMDCADCHVFNGTAHNW